MTSGNAYFLTSFKDMNEFTGYSLWDIVIDDLSKGNLIVSLKIYKFYRPILLYKDFCFSIKYKI